LACSTSISLLCAAFPSSTHLYFGQIEPGIRADVVETCEAQVEAMLEDQFAKENAPAV
jgi:hypothetical protein